MFDTRSNIWIGWQMLTVNSGWLGPNAMPTPAVNGRLASVISTAKTELEELAAPTLKTTVSYRRDCLFVEQPSLAFKRSPKKKGAVHRTAPQMPGRKRERNRNIRHPPPAAGTG